MTTKEQARFITNTFFKALEGRRISVKEGNIKEVIKNQNILEAINSGNRKIAEKLLKL
jgi:hypothetical protein